MRHGGLDQNAAAAAGSKAGSPKVGAGGTASRVLYAGAAAMLAVSTIATAAGGYDAWKLYRGTTSRSAAIPAGLGESAEGADTAAVAATPTARAAAAWRVAEVLGNRSSALREAIASANGSGCVAAATPGGLVLGGFDAARPLPIASVTKVFTAAVALRSLGPDFRFETKAVVLRQHKGGSSASVYLVGDGDPFLATPGFGEIAERAKAGWPRTPLEELAEQLVGAGIREVTALLGDAGIFDAMAWPAEMPEELRAQKLLPPVSGLSLDRNSSLGPRGEVIGFVPDPAAAAAEGLAAELRARGVRVRRVGVGTAKLSDAVGAEEGVETFVVRSEPLKSWLWLVLGRSDNFVAEMTAKRVAFQAAGRGTWGGFAEAVTQLARDWELELGSTQIRDGSGLSGNRSSCIDLVAFLVAAKHDQRMEPLWESLASPGRRGTTLEDRYAHIGPPVKLRAKTGSLRKVAALCGVVEGSAGAEVLFSVLVEAEGAANVRAAVEAPLVDALVSAVSGNGAWSQADTTRS